MNLTLINENTLVQQTTAEYMRDELGWDLVYAYNEETFGPEGILGRKHDRDVILTRYLGEALVTLNPNLPQRAYQEAIRQILEYSITHSTLQINRDKYELFKDGVLIQFKDDKGELVKRPVIFGGSLFSCPSKIYDPASFTFCTPSANQIPRPAQFL